MIAAGFGFSTWATVESLHDAYARASEGHAVSHLAAPDDKVKAAQFAALAQALCLPVIAVPAGCIAVMKTRTRSPRVAAERGAGSVAEAAALAASRGRLLAPRCISHDRMATCAIATGDPE